MVDGVFDVPDVGAPVSFNGPGCGERPLAGEWFILERRASSPVPEFDDPRQKP
ncbi:hypothetical protein [Streptomyces sp. NPDC057413]|uniref:hypothetical protein n=1 Tax=Streptomyces sp. NPDC057413 TaxID=3346124 RepID=UPI0036D1D5BE